MEQIQNRFQQFESWQDNIIKISLRIDSKKYIIDSEQIQNRFKEQHHKDQFESWQDNS